MSDSNSAISLSNARRIPRGRPVGTGIDDGERLARITAMLAANPGMRPTTAIKAVGITDPSAVRRLRDKLKAGPRVAIEMVRTRESFAARSVACPAADNENAFKLSEKPSIPNPQMPPLSSMPGGSDLVVACLDAAIRTWATLFAAQLQLVQQLVSNPLVRMTLTQHIAANELAASMMPVPASPRRSI